MNGIIPVKAFFLRELHALLLNRFLYAFSLVALAAGLSPLVLGSGEEATLTAPLYLLQAVLYILPLFAILIGTGSAQSELEENTLLGSQPVRHWTRIAGKFLALWLMTSLAVAQLLLPSALINVGLRTLLFFWAHAVAVGGVFLSLGLACGFITKDRVKGVLLGLAIWLFLFAGLNLLALAGLNIPWLRDTPALWLVLLMANPLDALRVSILFSLEQVPFATSSVPELGQWWLRHLGLWFALLSACWLAGTLFLSSRFLARSEP